MVLGQTIWDTNGRRNMQFVPGASSHEAEEELLLVVVAPAGPEPVLRCGGIGAGHNPWITCDLCFCR